MIMYPPGAFPGENGAEFLPIFPPSPLLNGKNSLPAAGVIQEENRFVCLPFTFLATSSAHPTGIASASPILPPTLSSFPSSLHSSPARRWPDLM